jgi:hypothetical protein
MGESVDVRLPIGHEPTFPARCVRCGRTRARGRIHVEAEYLDPDRPPDRRPADAWQDEKEVRVAAPACRRCLAIGRWWRLVPGACIALVVVIVAGGGLYVEYVHSGGWITPRDRYWSSRMTALAWTLAVGGVSVVLLVAWLIFRVRVVPPAFDVAVVGREVEYRFRRREYAREFARSNGVEPREAGPGSRRGRRRGRRARRSG